MGFVFPGGTIALAGTYDVTGTTIDNAPGGTVNFTGTIASIGSTLLSQAGTLNFGTIPLDATALTLDGGTLTSTAAMTVSGLMTVDVGTISGSGVVTADGGIMLNLQGATFVIDGRTLINPAGQTATWTGDSSTIRMSDGAVFDNQGTFQDQNAGVVSQQLGAASSFTDDGSFIKSGNSGECDFQQGIAFNATGGTVNVQTGTLGLLGGGTDTGATFTSEMGATLDFGGTHTLDAATDVAGAGTVGFVFRAAPSPWPGLMM